MDYTAFQLWTGFGILLVFLEFLLPGLVVVFVGLGALTVSLGLHFGYINSIPAQFSTWFVSTLIYTFTLRIAIVRMYPSDTEKQDIDEDHLLVGARATVTEAIASDCAGRIAYGDTTWQAVSHNHETIPKGATVFVVSRENITLAVQTHQPEPTNQEGA